MLYIKLFYDNFTKEDIAGLFSFWHFFFVFIFFASLALALWTAKSVTHAQLEKIIWWSSIAVSIVEVIKISLRIAKGGGVDSWIPLYYCSLFIYAVWMTRSKWEWLSRMGYSFITMGGILAACLFTLYPTTSLAIYPALHPASLHSLIYHLLMAFVGLLILIKRVYVPKARDAIYYGIFVLLACAIGYFINERFGSNCMFLHNAYKLPVLDDLLVFSHPLYMLVVALAQASLMYWFNYGLYILFEKHRRMQ